MSGIGSGNWQDKYNSQNDLLYITKRSTKCLRYHILVALL